MVALVVDLTPYHSPTSRLFGQELAPRAGPAVDSGLVSTDFSSLPCPAQATISAELGRDHSSYQVVAVLTGFHAANPQHALAADFTDEGVHIRSGTARWGVSFTGFGY